MGRTYDEWIAQQDQAVVAKTRAGDEGNKVLLNQINWICLLYTSPSPRDLSTSRMPSSA